MLKNTLEIFSDYACPWCYFLLPSLEKAKQEKNDLQVWWRTYLLRSDLPIEGEKYQANDTADNSVTIATAEKLQLAWTKGRIKRFKTQPAHIVGKWATTEGKGEAYRKLIFEAYFAKHENIALPEVLEKIISKIGLPTNKLQEVLAENNPFHQEMEKDLQAVKELNIRNIPTLFYEGKKHVGYMDTKDLKKFLTKK